MEETLIVIGAHPKFDYFCWNCGQVRLSFKELWLCGNCSSPDILKGRVGTLNRTKLLVQRQDKLIYALHHTPGLEIL